MAFPFMRNQSQPFHFPITESSVLPDPYPFFSPELLSYPLPTNSFFQNFVLKNGDQPEYIHPYLIRSSLFSLSISYPSCISNDSFIYQPFSPDFTISASNDESQIPHKVSYFSDLRSPFFICSVSGGTCLKFSTIHAILNFSSCCYNTKFVVHLNNNQTWVIYSSSPINLTHDLSNINSDAFSESEQIKKSILYLTTPREIWAHLEALFNVTNGARKYKLNKEAYETEQGENTINEYYIVMKGLWEKQDALNLLPPITHMTPEINAFIRTQNKQKEELRLFQFLTGLNDDYKAHRSQILMQSPLPTVEAACAQLQQEESQRDVMQLSKLSLESSVMYGKGQNEKKLICTSCGGKGHKIEKFWTVRELRIKYKWDTRGWGELLMLAHPLHVKLLSNDNCNNVAVLDDLKYKSIDRDLVGVVGDSWSMGTQPISVTWHSIKGISEESYAEIISALCKDVEGLDSSSISTTSSYFYGKLITRAARMALIAEEVCYPEVIPVIRKFLKETIEPWLDGASNEN
ncbi:Endo-1 3(4)-beta-glucanase 2, partial [Bienertia sinuspersici]